MSETLRAFVAIELPQHAREALAALVRSLAARASGALCRSDPMAFT